MYLRYLWYVLKHKWFVFIECCKSGMPIRGLLHDISKLRPSEFIPYARYFYGVWTKEADWHGDVRNHVPWKYTDMGISDAFDKAWLLHQKRNPHHWQYWLLVMDSSSKEFTAQEAGQGYEMFLCRNNSHLAMFDEKVLCPEDRTMPFGINDNAWRFLKEIRDRLNKTPKAINMPLKYTKEMLSDWNGAGKAINGYDNTKNWYQENKDNMLLHEETRQWIEENIFRIK